ncbi:hypothetical protein L7F22_004924 [Adiantum nelumboides]|nr:hypothetical protein [Adiantum nelumboides]
MSDLARKIHSAVKPSKPLISSAPQKVQGIVKKEKELASTTKSIPKLPTIVGKVSSSKATVKTTIKFELDKKGKKVYELPGQKHDPPEERDPLRIFYESLYHQNPKRTGGGARIGLGMGTASGTGSGLGLGVGESGIMMIFGSGIGSGSSVSDTLVGYIRSATSTKEAWDILARRFEGKSIIKVMHLKSKLNEATKSSSESVHEYLLKLRNIQDELAAIREEVSDADMIQSILKRIKEYKHFVTSLAVRESFPSLENLTSLLLQKEERFGEDNPTSRNLPSALIMREGERYNSRGGGRHGRVFHRNNNSRFAASSNSTPTHNTNQPFEGRRGHHHQGSRGIGNGRRIGNCYNCGIFGHWQRDCTRSPTTNGRPQISNGPSNNEVSNYASSSSNPHHKEAFLSTYMAHLQEEVEDGWYVDSGASNHMTHHHDWFTSVQPFEGEGSILTGDDSSCQFGKQQRRRFKKSTYRARQPLELIHSDVWGPSQTTFMGGAHYFLTFVDDMSRKVWVYFLKNKSEVFSYFKQFKAMVEKECGRFIKTLRSDQGGDFKSKEFEELCWNQGIRR